jgi:DNA-binding Lrp family transcriptional regulator
METLTRRSAQLLRILYEKGKSTSTYTVRMKQDEFAGQLGISRQALNVHLRKLRDLSYVRTGRGFIDVTDKGLSALGMSTTPAFILIKVSPLKRSLVYEKIKELSVQGAFRIAGDIDALVMAERGRLDELLRRLSSIDGIQDTKSYIAIETIR